MAYVLGNINLAAQKAAMRSKAVQAPSACVALNHCSVKYASIQLHGCHKLAYNPNTCPIGARLGDPVLCACQLLLLEQHSRSTCDCSSAARMYVE